MQGNIFHSHMLDTLGHRPCALYIMPALTHHLPVFLFTTRTNRRHRTSTYHGHETNSDSAHSHEHRHRNCNQHHHLYHYHLNHHHHHHRRCHHHHRSQHFNSCRHTCTSALGVGDLLGVDTGISRLVRGGSMDMVMGAAPCWPSALRAHVQRARSMHDGHHELRSAVATLGPDCMHGAYFIYVSRTSKLFWCN